MGGRYGALGATFQLARIFQVCSLIAIIGMTAKFISSIVSNNATPPNILIATISVVRAKDLTEQAKDELIDWGMTMENTNEIRQPSQSFIV